MMKLADSVTELDAQRVRARRIRRRNLHEERLGLGGIRAQQSFELARKLLLGAAPFGHLHPNLRDTRCTVERHTQSGDRREPATSPTHSATSRL